MVPLRQQAFAGRAPAAGAAAQARGSLPAAVAQPWAAGTKRARRVDSPGRHSSSLVAKHPNVVQARVARVHAAADDELAPNSRRRKPPARAGHARGGVGGGGHGVGLAAPGVDAVQLGAAGRGRGVGWARELGLDSLRGGAFAGQPLGCLLLLHPGKGPVCTGQQSADHPPKRTASPLR